MECRAHLDRSRRYDIRHGCSDCKSSVCMYRNQQAQATGMTSTCCVGAWAAVGRVACSCKRVRWHSLHFRAGSGSVLGLRRVCVGSGQRESVGSRLLGVDFWDVIPQPLSAWGSDRQAFRMQNAECKVNKTRKGRSHILGSLRRTDRAHGVHFFCTRSRSSQMRQIVGPRVITLALISSQVPTESLFIFVHMIP